MQKELVTQSDIKIVGITTRTNNKNEMNPQTAKIGETFGRYFGQQLASQIPHRKNPGVTFSIYTNYESNEHGDYTYFLGEAVDSFDNIPDHFQTLLIPAGQFQKFTTPVGKIPDIVIQAWQQIWQMSADDFGGPRAYRADYEVYDQRAQDPQHACVDIFVGVLRA